MKRRLLYLTLSLLGLLALSATNGGDRLRRDLGLPKIWQHTSSPSASWSVEQEFGYGQQPVEPTHDGFYHSDITDTTISSDGEFFGVMFDDGSSVSSW